MLSLIEFIRLGADQWRSQSNPFAALFFLLVGPLGTHARIRNARVINTLQGIDLNGKHILDMGCGHGYILFWLARRFPTAILKGIEVDLVQVKNCNAAAQAARLKNLQFQKMNYDDLPDEPKYDLVIAIDVLEHLHEDVGMLKRIASLLQPNGLVVIHVPLRHQLQRRIFPVFRYHTVDDHVRDEYLPDELRKKVEQAGLCAERIEYGFGFWGELSFEINNLFWDNRWLRNTIALITLPIALLTGYLDSRSHLTSGNSMVMVAKAPDCAVRRV